MGASTLMTLGMKAMTASYAALQATGHNIANANVAGYSRQQAELATAKGQYTGAGFFGKGVDVVAVTRTHDAFLTREAAVTRSLASLDVERFDRLNQLQQVFGTGESGLGYATSQFWNALSDLASRPGDSATRQAALARAQDLSSRFAAAGEQLDTLQRALTEDLKAQVASVNRLAADIAKANSEIAALQGLGQTPNDLLDQRDRLINELSGYVQLTTVGAEDGTTSVFIAGGQSLVLGVRAEKLSVVQDPYDSSRAALALGQGASQLRISEQLLGGGSVTGLMRFQNEDLVDARNLIGQLAASVALAFNEQQRLGVNLNPPPGSVPSSDLFAIGAPQALPASTNAKDAGGAFISSVSLDIVDPAALQPAEYELRPGSVAGTYDVLRLSNPPKSFTVASGDVVDGFRITVGAPPPAPGDRFLLQPVTRAANGMDTLLTDPLDLAAASPLVASVDPANTGTASVKSLTMNAPPGVPDATARVTFSNDSGDYVWELFDASNNLLASGAGTWQAGQPIPAPPTDINGFSLQLSGVPRGGDIVTVSPLPPAYAAQNNGNALALAQLRDAALVNGGTAVDGYAAALADIGVRVQGAAAASEISMSVAAQSEQARASVAGVNLDEEAARLIQFQQSYQAAAKVLQVAQGLFDTLLDVTR